MTANAQTAIFPSRKRSSRRYDKSCALFSDPVGSITFAARHKRVHQVHKTVLLAC